LISAIKAHLSSKCKSRAVQLKLIIKGECASDAALRESIIITKLTDVVIRAM